MIILAQSSPDSIGLPALIVLIGLALIIGAVVGYAFSFRYKRQYLVAARQLANLRGENFRGELTTLGGSPLGSAQPVTAPKTVTARKRPSPNPAESNANAISPTVSEPCKQCQRLTAEKSALLNETADLKRTADDAGQSLAQLEESKQVLADQLAAALGEVETLQRQCDDRPAEIDTNSAWQIEQLHREQIAMQMKMDEYVEQIARLTQQTAGG